MIIQQPPVITINTKQLMEEEAKQEELKNLKYLLLTTDGDKVQAKWNNVSALEIRAMLTLTLQMLDKPNNVKPDHQTEVLPADTAGTEAIKEEADLKAI